MLFLWPSLLWLLLIVPMLVGAYVWLMRRRKKSTVNYASLALIKQALAGSSAWRRHVPPVLMLLALTALLLAAARPVGGDRHRFSDRVLPCQ